jgi:outer membrane lipoprotein-sorting protein
MKNSDRKIATGVMALTIALLFAAWPARTAEGLSPKEILDRVDDLFRGQASYGHLTMTIATENWRRSLDLEFWSQGRDKSLIRILAPQKEKGTATLRVGNDIWNYLPKVNRTIKLPSSMMSSSWMGSHFTNDDLVRESRMADDYTYEITFDGERDGQKVTEITCLPKPEAAIVWGKVLIAVRDSDYLPLDTKYYDEDLKLARTMVFSDLGDLGGRRLPRLMTVIPADKPGEKTEMAYRDLAFDPPLAADTFSLRSLTR